ncbi:hypothetical protein SJAG_00591 [Schizosaccharomyces japonicus yFS275]|uniref:Uncharacterized protein n=1 Tax=Schizosaccharomyces japonicus (strain yFS275 / FY16936) TaxID=402676 RepID=B6JW22_SCHJY|nr:hypothetical protein SJAG_00591 [Schizosaccharomyces japonicus yFS275]EEB05573.1 hypothetical protein SJAG_00591 [Schizosaccharomyces japonicus yFS275]
MSALYKNRVTFDELKHFPFGYDNRSEQLSKLEFILSKLCIALTARSWQNALKWDKELDKWFQFGYRIPRKAQKTLIPIYYELALSLNLPGEFADVTYARFSQLINSPSCPDESCESNVCTHPIEKRFLTVTDLQLDWRLAFNYMKACLRLDKKYVPENSNSYWINQETIIREASAFFPAEEVHNVLNEVVPLFSISRPADALTAVGMLSLLLPTSPSSLKNSETNPQVWLPTIFQLCDTFSLLKDQATAVTLTDVCSRLAARSLNGDYKYQFSEYGVFTREQVRTLFHYGLQMLPLPSKEGEQPSIEDKDVNRALRMFRTSGESGLNSISRLVICSLSPKCEESKDSILTMLEDLISLTLPYFNPSFHGYVDDILFVFLEELSLQFLKRWTYENDEEVSIPKERRLTKSLKKTFVKMLIPPLLYAIRQNSSYCLEPAKYTLRNLSILEPDVVVPCMLKIIYPIFQSLDKTPDAATTLKSLTTLAPAIAEHKRYRPHVISLLRLLREIDPEDFETTQTALRFITILSHYVSFYNIDKNADSNIFTQWFQTEVKKLELRNFDDFESQEETYKSVIDYDNVVASGMTKFGDWLLAFIRYVFDLLDSSPDKYKDDFMKERGKLMTEIFISEAIESFVPALSDEWLDLALSKFRDFIATSVQRQPVDTIKTVCAAFTDAAPEKTWRLLYPTLSTNIIIELDGEKAGLSRGSSPSEILPCDRTLYWNISILNAITSSNGKYFLGKEEELTKLLDKLLLCRGFIGSLASSFVRQLVYHLISVYPTAPSQRQQPNISNWGKLCEKDSFKLHWNIPSEQEISLTIFICNRYMTLCMDRLRQMVIETKPIDPTEEWLDEVTSYFDWLCSFTSALAELFEIPDMEFVPDHKHDEFNTFTNDYPFLRSKVNCHRFTTLQQLSELTALRERLGSLYVELHDVLSDSTVYQDSLMKKLIDCERSFLSDYGYSNSIDPLKAARRRYCGSEKYFDYVPQAQPHPATLLGRNVYIRFLEHLRLSSVPRVPTPKEKAILQNLATSCCTQPSSVCKSACLALQQCISYFRDAYLTIYQTLMNIAKNSQSAEVITEAIETIAYTGKRQWRILPPLIRELIQRWNESDSMPIIAGDVFACYIEPLRVETFFPMYKHHNIPQISLQSETEELRLLVAATQQQMQKSLEAAAEVRDFIIDAFPNAHWTLQTWIAKVFRVSFSNMFIPPTPKALKIFVEGMVSSHPATREKSCEVLFVITNYIWELVLSKDNAENIFCQNLHLPNELELKNTPENKDKVNQALYDFRNCEKTYCIKNTFPEWLITPDVVSVQQRVHNKEMDFSSVQSLFDTAVKSIDEDWLQKVLSFFAQGPSEPDYSLEGPYFYPLDSEDWRDLSVHFWESIFRLLLNGDSNISAKFLKEQIEKLCSSSDRYCNETGVYLLNGIVLSLPQCRTEIAEKHWDWIVPVIDTSLQNSLWPDNQECWSHLIHTVFKDSDPVLFWPLYNLLANLHHAVFFEHVSEDTAKLNLLEEFVRTVGWRFQNHKPLYEYLLSALQQPQEECRKAIGAVLADLGHAQVHVTYDSVDALLKANSTTGSLDSFFEDNPTTKITALVEAFEKLETLRLQAKVSSDYETYSCYASTMVHWTERLLLHPCGLVVFPIVPDTVLPAVLHMLDVKGEDDLQQAASSLLILLENMNYPLSTTVKFCDACTAILKDEDSEHRRLQLLTTLPSFVLHHSVFLSEELKLSVLETLVTILDDTRPEVQENAVAAVATLLQCFSKPQTDIILDLSKRFFKVLDTTPMPKSAADNSTTEEEHNQLIARRHAAVLGLSALAKSVSVGTPLSCTKPILLRLIEFTNDSDLLGTTAKKALAEFKVMQVDIWPLVSGYLTQERLDELTKFEPVNDE